MTKHRWLLVAAATLAVAGCYKTPKPNCTFACGEGGSCPTDYACGTDDICHLMQGGGLAPCEQSFNDAAQADASTSDAPAIDAPMVADAPMVDASMVDAPMVDARPVDARPVDARPPDAHVDATVDANLCPMLAIMDDGTQAAGKQDLVISLVQPGATGKIELYNTTATAIDLSAKTYVLASAGTTSALTTGTVPAHGYLSLTSPFGDQSGGGEVVLYGAATAQPSDIDDYVCWDTLGATNAKADAVTATKWSGNCAAAITGTAIARKNNVMGTTGGDYDSASTRAACN